MSSFRLLCIAPEAKGGIRSYTEALWPAIQKAWTGDAMDPVFHLPEMEELERLQPDLIHVQHEFGLFGSKIPGFYEFPGWLRRVRSTLPRTKIIATAHTVLTRDSAYPWRGRGMQAPIRWLANRALVPLFRKTWLEGTWGKLNGVIVHSKTQVETVKSSGCAKVVEIPHFVPAPPVELARGSRGATGPDAQAADAQAEILVFGYLTPEKGTDVAIEAMRFIEHPARLVLAGGLRREGDRRYFESCERKIRELGLQDRVLITGYVAPEEINGYFDRATLVLAPFRETSGSGSLVQAFARGAATLASDLPLNQEMNTRQPGCLALFRSEDARDLARKTDGLLRDMAARTRLQEGARAYAQMNSIAKTVERHLDFYGEI